MIRFDDVSFHYGGENGTGDGVDHIDLTIADGAFTVLVGESGCGKTTLTRLINGLAPNFYEGEMEGAVYVDDICTTTAELHDTAALIGSVFQNPKSQFFNVDTTGELVFGCENQALSRDEMRRRLDRTRIDMQLDALMDRNIFELSGGEKQQIACGSVYASGPRVFVMDEPSANLDKKAIRRLHNILAKMKDEGKTIVLSEHRLHYLMDLADEFVYVKDGRIERTFSTQELCLLDDPRLSELGLRCTDLHRLVKVRTTSPAGGGPDGSGGKGQDGPYDDNHADARTVGRPALEAVDLSCSRGSTRILDVDRIAFPEHSVVAVIGDNGCGKSTLAESLCGIIPSDGTVAIGGTFETARTRSKRSFMVMQDVNRQLFADDVAEEVSLNASVSEEEVDRVLEGLGLLEYKDRHPASLSGGQKQRVAIASALCAGKDILFYDEPTSGLDRRGMERFGTLLRAMRDKVLCSLIITHDPELILQCCTHVLHVRDGRAVALYPLDDEGAARVRSYFLSLSDESTSKRRDRTGAVGKILRYAGEQRRSIALAATLMVVGALASVVPYLLIYGLIDAALSGGTVTLAAAAPAVAAIAVCEVVHAASYTVGLVLSHKAAFSTLENLRKFLQERLDGQSIGTVKDLGAGAVKKLFTDDIESIELLLAHMIPEGAANIAVVAVVLLTTFAVDWQMALLTLIVVGLGVIVSRQMYSVGIDKMGSYFAATKRLNNTIVEYVEGMEVVRVFNRQADSGEKFERAVSGYRDQALGWYRICWPWMALYGSLFSSIVLYSLPFGVLMVLLGRMTLSSCVLVLCLSFGIGPLLLHCMAFIGAIPQVSFKIQVLEKVLDQAPLKSGSADFAGRGHRVVFEDVRFAYRDAEVLKGISFTADEGRMTALVGESGSGKSTIARLLVHHYDVAGGSISIGGQHIDDMTQVALSEQISYVSQDLFLFDRSILENIRVGRPDATDEEVIEAAKRAQCDDFIRDLEKGYNTNAGTAGRRLSGGQRQRIAFARAILKDAPIVVLDEATAFVDPENEQRMSLAIREIIAGKTVIVIAHKLRSIVGADKIIMLHRGRVLAEGTQGELLSSCPEYRALWDASEQVSGWTLRDGGRVDAQGADGDAQGAGGREALSC